MFNQSVKINRDLMGRIKECSEAAGYSSPEEFVQHVLEREVARLEEAEAESNEEIKRKLKGLGYLD